MSKYRKALFAALAALLGALGFALEDGSVTLLEVVGVLSVALAALGGTYAVPNASGGDRPLSGDYR